MDNGTFDTPSALSFRNILDNMLEGCQVIDRDFRYLYVNKVVANQGRRTVEELIGHTMMEMYPGIENTEMFSYLKRCMNEGILHHMENEFTFADGTKGWFELRIEPIDEGVFILSLDITERKLAQEHIEQQVKDRTRELQEEQARLEASINSLNIGFIMTDNKKNIISINGAARRILCVDPNSSPGAVHTSSRIAYDCTLEDIVAQLSKEFDLVSQIDKCLTERKTISIKDVPFKGLFLQFFLAPIVVLRENLEVIGVVILTEDITEETLLNRSKDDFFSIASHELRTPLTAIRGNTALIKQYYADKLKNNQGLTEMIDDIHSASVGLIEIVNDFLDMSRLEQGRTQFKKDKVSLIELINDIIKEYSTTGLQKNLYLNLDQTPNMPEIVGDSDRIRQVLINLVSNALKFTEVGGVTILVNPFGNFVKLSIKDTGKGIPFQNQKLLFKKFQQAGNNPFIRDTSKSTGLGLYISKLLIERMGGEIKLEYSEEGKGSIFSFTLPMVGKPEGGEVKIDTDISKPAIRVI